MTTFTVDDYRTILAANPPEHWDASALGRLRAALFDGDRPDGQRVAEARAVLEALEQTRAEPTELLAG